VRHRGALLPAIRRAIVSQERDRPELGQHLVSTIAATSPST